MKNKAKQYQERRKDNAEVSSENDFEEKPDGQNTDCWTHLRWRIKVACPWFFKPKK